MTNTEVCNLALAKIGASLINDFDEQSKEALTCRQFYENTLSNTLRRHLWRCAMKRAALAKLSATPVFGWENMFALPADYLQIVQADTLDTEFTIEGRNLLSNSDSVNIRYIAKPVDLSVLDSWCLKAVYTQLAVEISYTITANANLRVSLIDELENVIVPQARYYSSIESNEPDLEHNSSWIISRGSFS